RAAGVHRVVALLAPLDEQEDCILPRGGWDEWDLWDLWDLWEEVRPVRSTCRSHLEGELCAGLDEEALRGWDLWEEVRPVRSTYRSHREGELCAGLDEEALRGWDLWEEVRPARSTYRSHRSYRSHPPILPSHPARHIPQSLHQQFAHRDGELRQQLGLECQGFGQRSVVPGAHGGSFAGAHRHRARRIVDERHFAEDVAGADGGHDDFFAIAIRDDVEVPVFDREQRRVALSRPDQIVALAEIAHLAELFDTRTLLAGQIAKEWMIGLRRKDVHVLFIMTTSGTTRNAAVPSRSRSSVPP